MGKYSKKVSKQRKVLTAVTVALSVVLVLLVIVLMCLGRGEKPEKVEPGTTEGTMAPTVAEEVSNVKELLVESVTERDDAMLVVTTYGTVKYPYAFSDLMTVEAETFKDYAVLEFGATIDGTVHKLYSLIFNGEEGFPVGTLLVDGETYVVTALFHDVSGIGDDDMVTFYATQETFNDVVNSLSENQGFTAAD